MSNSLFFRTLAIDTVLMSSSLESLSWRVIDSLFFSSYGRLLEQSFYIMTDKYFLGIGQKFTCSGLMVILVCRPGVFACFDFIVLTIFSNSSSDFPILFPILRGPNRWI
jgi:hypothetical protein